MRKLLVLLLLIPVASMLSFGQGLTKGPTKIFGPTLLSAGVAGGGLSHVNNDSSGNNNGIGNTLTLVPPNTVTSGELEIVVGNFINVGSIATSTRCTSWTLIWGPITATNTRFTDGYLWGCIASSTGAESIVLTDSGAGGQTITGNFMECSGCTLTTDGASTFTTDFNTTITSSGITTTHAADFLVGIAGYVASPTVTGPFTISTSLTAAAPTVTLAWQIVSSTNTYAVTFGSTSGWIGANINAFQ